MKIEWYFSREDIQGIRLLREQGGEDPFVKERRDRNLAVDKPEVTKSRFWKAMSAMRLTSMQKSGPKSAVAKLIQTDPYPLEFEKIGASSDPWSAIETAIRSSGGIRFHGKIATDLAKNFSKLEESYWDETLDRCNRLIGRDTNQSSERAVAHFIANTFRGFGPKQSRNLLQALGLTRYEIPIDSRVTKWLRKSKFPVPVNAILLSDPEYYDFVLDGFQKLSADADIFPCELDAIIFAQADNGAWSSQDIAKF